MMNIFSVFPFMLKVFQAPQAMVRWDPLVPLASRVSLGSQALLDSRVPKEKMAAVIPQTV